MTLDTLTPTIKASTGQTLLNGATLAFYPSFEPSDPRPAKHRGAYFSGSAYIQLPPAPSTSGPPLMFSDTLSASVWIRTQYVGLQVLFQKFSRCDQMPVLQLTLLNSNILEIYAASFSQNDPITFSITAPTVSFDQWTFVAFTLDYQAGTDQTIGKIYYDALEVATYTQVFRLIDIFQLASQTIGTNSLGFNGFKGFMWKLTIYPYIRTFTNDIVSISCPAGLSYCLSATPISQTYSGENCASSCLDGCVRSSDCSPCADMLCDVCFDFETLLCSQCIPNTAVVGTCACLKGLFFNVPTRSCDSCSPTCRECVQMSSSCTECFDNAVLDFEKHCSCSPGFYPNPTASHCSLCSNLCLTCSSEYTCTSCRAREDLKGDTCVCSNGYYGTANNCKECSWGCQLCSGEICERCMPGYFNIKGVCSLNCPSSFSEDKNYWICIPLPNPYRGVTVSGRVDRANCVTLNFSQTVQPEVTLEALSLRLTDVDAHTYNFTANLSMWTSHPNQIYNISVNIHETYLPADNEFSIVFLHPEVFTDIFGNHLLNFSLSLTLNPVGTSNTTALTPSDTKEIEAVVASSIVVGVIIGVVTGNPMSLFTMINNIQLLSYLPLSTIPLPTKLKDQLLGVSLLSFFSNPAAEYLSSSTEVDTSTPNFARDYGFTTPSFLSNAGTLFITALINLGVFGVLWVLSKVFRGSTRIKRGLEGYHWRNVGMHWILSYLDLSVAAYLQVLRVITMQLSFTSAKTGLISCLGCLVATANSILPLGLVYMSIRDRLFISSRHFQLIPHWSFLYAGLKNNKGWLSSAYYAVFLLRRLIYALTLIYLDRSPFAQSILCYCHSMLVLPIQTIIYLSIYRPFSSKLEAVTITISEIAVGVLFSLVIAFNFDISASTSELISTLASVCVYTAVCFPTLTGLISLYFQIRDVLTGYIKVKSTLISVSAGIYHDVPTALQKKADLQPSARPNEVYKAALGLAN